MQLSVEWTQDNRQCIARTCATALHVAQGIERLRLRWTQRGAPMNRISGPQSSPNRRRMDFQVRGRKTFAELAWT